MTTGSGSVILDAIAMLPPLARMFAYLLPVVVFVSWRPWAWVAGGVAGAWAATWGGTDALLLVGLVAGALAYMVNCRWDPHLDCWWCKGKPRRRPDHSPKQFHFCFVCGGSGRRLRLGALAWAKHRDKD